MTAQEQITYRFAVKLIGFFAERAGDINDRFRIFNDQLRAAHYARLSWEGGNLIIMFEPDKDGRFLDGPNPGDATP